MKLLATVGANLFKNLSDQTVYRKKNSNKNFWFWFFSEEDKGKIIKKKKKKKRKNKVDDNDDNEEEEEELEEYDPTTLTEEDMKKILARTSYNIKEIQKWHRDFLKECPDGELSKGHLQKLFKKVFPHVSNGDHEKFVSFIFRMFDIDNSNILEFNEFLMVSKK